MSANTNWLVRVIKTHFENIEISAVTSEEAKEEAKKLLGVIAVEEVMWIDPDSYGVTDEIS